jgi:hypothetical protein
MDTQPTTPQPFNLQTRVVNILTKPKQEWPVIAAEPKDIAGLYSKYIVLVAAIPPICGAIGNAVIGMSLPFYGHYRTPFGTAIAMAVLQYVLTLVGVYVGAFVIAKLAPSFQSESDVAQATKLVAYSWTPAWVAGVLLLIPALSPIVALVSLYTIYLMYLGVSPLMKTPADKAIVYLIVSAIVLIVVYVVVGLVVGAIMLAMGLGIGAMARPAI